MNFLKNTLAEYAFNPPGEPPTFLLEAFNSTAKFNYISEHKIPIVIVQRKGEFKERKTLVIRVVYTHGNSESIYYVYPRLVHIAEHIYGRYKEEFNCVVTVVGWTYPGFHPFITEMSRSKSNIELCTTLIWDELPRLDGVVVEGEHTVIEIAMGYSIGTYPASFLNGHPSRPSIIFLIAPFSKIPSGAGMYTNLESVTGPLLNNQVHLEKKTPSIIFLLFGMNDTVLPFSLNKALTQISHVKYIVMSDYAHNDFGTEAGVHQSLAYLCDQIDDIIDSPELEVSDVVIPIRATPSPDCDFSGMNEMLKQLNITSTIASPEKEVF